MRTSKLTVITKLGNATIPMSDEPVPVNRTLDARTTSPPANFTFANPLEIVIKRPDISKYVNATNRPLIPIGLGKAKNSITKDEKSSGKGAGRRKRTPIGPTSYSYLIRNHPAPSPLLDYYYPSSKEIPQVKSEELSLLMRGVDPFLDMDPFDEDFVDIASKPLPKPLFLTKPKHKVVPLPFMEPFFSSEDLTNQSSQDLDEGDNDRGSGSEGDTESQSKERTPSRSEEKDAYDIHGYRDPIEEERTVTKGKPPAYKLAVSKQHDYTPMRLMPEKPATVTKMPDKVKTVQEFKTKVIHQYPGYALPGASTEASVDKGQKENQVENGQENEEESEEEEHIHHHFYDKLKHVHHNPPKGFDPDSFRLTIPSIVKQQNDQTMNNKKHKHFHHIKNAPVIVKYTKKKKEKKQKKKKPLTESEEEANYDEEGELSEKEIENAYKTYDDSEINQDITHDYQVDESGEETKIKEVKVKTKTAVPQQSVKNNMTSMGRVFNLFSNITSNPKLNTFKNFWELVYNLK